MLANLSLFHVLVATLVPIVGFDVQLPWLLSMNIDIK